MRIWGRSRSLGVSAILGRPGGFALLRVRRQREHVRLGTALPVYLLAELSGRAVGAARRQHAHGRCGRGSRRGVVAFRSVGVSVVWPSGRTIHDVRRSRSYRPTSPRRSPPDGLEAFPITVAMVGGVLASTSYRGPTRTTRTRRRTRRSGTGTGSPWVLVGAAGLLSAQALSAAPPRGVHGGRNRFLRLCH
jgi:hypothetical protein